MTYTDNLKLKLPEEDDLYNVEDFNENAITIDTQIANLEQVIKVLQTNFQDGVDRAYVECVVKGSTPYNRTLASIADAILRIPSLRFPEFYSGRSTIGEDGHISNNDYGRTDSHKVGSELKMRDFLFTPKLGDVLFFNPLGNIGNDYLISIRFHVVITDYFPITQDYDTYNVSTWLLSDFADVRYNDEVPDGFEDNEEDTSYTGRHSANPTITVSHTEQNPENYRINCKGYFFSDADHSALVNYTMQYSLRIGTEYIYTVEHTDNKVILTLYDDNFSIIERKVIEPEYEEDDYIDSNPLPFIFGTKLFGMGRRKNSEVDSEVGSDLYVHVDLKNTYWTVNNAKVWGEDTLETRKKKKKEGEPGDVDPPSPGPEPPDPPGPGPTPEPGTTPDDVADLWERAKIANNPRLITDSYFIEELEQTYCDEYTPRGIHYIDYKRTNPSYANGCTIDTPDQPWLVMRYPIEDIFISAMPYSITKVWYSNNLVVKLQMRTQFSDWDDVDDVGCEFAGVSLRHVLEEKHWINNINYIIDTHIESITSNIPHFESLEDAEAFTNIAQRFWYGSATITELRSFLNEKMVIL